MTVADALIIWLVTWGFSHWVRYRIQTKRGAYWAGVAVMFVFWLGCVTHYAPA